MENKKTEHSVYNLNYHIVFVSKYRHEIFKDEVECYVKERLKEICIQYDWELMAIEVMPDHIHLFVSAQPRVSPLSIATTLKSIVAVDIFKKFPTLKQQYFWGSGLFSRGCYYGSAGSVSATTIKRYIEEQKLHD